VEVGVFRIVVASTALVALALAGCSSSKHVAAGSTPPPSTTPGTSQATSPSSTDSSSSPALQDADAATTATITKLYTEFFNPATSPAKAATLLQDGSAYGDTLAKAAVTAKQQKTSVTVSKVQLQSPHYAVVTFTLLIGGTPTLADQTGYAVLDGTWKVSGLTFCGLIQLQGPLPPACSLPAATAAPTD
jgi:hypothetical protein